MDWSSSPTAQTLPWAPSSRISSILRPVGVLKLVHQNEAEPLLVRPEPVGVLAEQGQRVQHQVVEVHRVRRLERRPQRRVDSAATAASRSNGEPAASLRGRHHPVLRRRDQRLHRARREQLG